MNEKSVLIVDDDKDIQSAIQMILELHGYVVASVSNGKEALEALMREPAPSVILLDLMMPVMDGFEFLHTIESGQMAKNIPIIVMTAARNKASEIKKYTTLLKPFEVTKLLSLIGECYQKSI
ncbi:MAG: response regulator [Bdellovibrionota bacterium]